MLLGEYICGGHWPLDLGSLESDDYTAKVRCTANNHTAKVYDSFDIKGSMPPCIDHMELLAWMQRADFSEHIQRFKLHETPLNFPHFDAPNTKFAPTVIDAPQHHFTSL